MTAAHLGPTISDPLSWKQICERYPDQWVCLVEFARIDPCRFAFRTARVVGHSPERRVAVEQSRPWWRHYEEVGQHFTGPSPRHIHRRAPRFVSIDLPWDLAPLAAHRDDDDAWMVMP
jgi:hypothetical protein